MCFDAFQDGPTNDLGHALGCDCPECLPELYDANEAALREDDARGEVPIAPVTADEVEAMFAARAAA